MDSVLQSVGISFIPQATNPSSLFTQPANNSELWEVTMSYFVILHPAKSELDRGRHAWAKGPMLKPFC